MRYFFHIHDAQGVVPDEEGSELPNIAAAVHEARLSARDFVIENLKSGKALPNRWIEIVDGDGKVLDRMRIRDVVD